MEPAFTICICTHNRAGLLPAAVESACRQDFDPAAFEVLVIDNASTDATSAVAADLSRLCPNLRICREETVGLSHARNRAAAEAQSEWLAYLDDDALAPAGWLAAAAEIIRRERPQLLGGPFSAYYTTPKPAWFKDAYGSVDQGPAGRCLEAHEYLAGGNLLIRRGLLLEAGGFPVELGMAGGRIAYGEETALQRRLRRMDPAVCIYYAPGLAIRHRVAPRKMQLLPEASRRWREGRSAYLAFSDGRHSLSFRYLLGFLILPVYILILVSLGALLRDRRRYPAWQNYYYEVVNGRIAAWGKLYERLRQVISAARRRA